MKTTVDIADPLLRDAKQVAAATGRTLRSLVEDGLRLVLQQHRDGTGFELADGSVDGNGLQPDAGDGSWENLRRLIYEDPAP